MKFRHLLLIVFAFIFAVALATVVSDPSDSSASDVYIYQNLDFNSSQGDYSAHVINTQAGADVCSYENGTLVFFKSSTFYFKNVSESRPLMNFNDNIDQSIRIDNGAVIKIGYAENPMLESSSERYSVIDAKCRSFSIYGSGELIIASALTGTYDFNIDAITSSCNMFIKDVSLEITNADGSPMFGRGIVLTSCYLELNKCSLDIRTQTISLAFNFHGLTAWKSDGSVIHIVSEGMALNCTGTYSRDFSHQSEPKVSKYSSGKDRGDLNDEGGDLMDYKYISIGTKTNNGNDATFWVVIILFIAVFIITLWIISGHDLFKRYYKGKSRTVILNDVDENVVRKMDANYVGIGKDSKEKVPISVISDVRGESFAIYIDGLLYGYITNLRSVLDVESGNQLTAIKSLDQYEETLVQQSINYRSGMKITVKKSGGGYKIIIKGGRK